LPECPLARLRTLPRSSADICFLLNEIPCSLFQLTLNFNPSAFSALINCAAFCSPGPRHSSHRQSLWIRWTRGLHEAARSRIVSASSAVNSLWLTNSSLMLRLVRFTFGSSAVLPNAEKKCFSKAAKAAKAARPLTAIAGFAGFTGLKKHFFTLRLLDKRYKTPVRGLRSFAQSCLLPVV